jgi:eukaryotic-like serine/threonine-protein kinase
MVPSQFQFTWPASSSTDRSTLSEISEGPSPIARLVEEMSARWRKGERILAEEFLSRYPELWNQPEQALRLIYEEICLRQEFEENLSEAEIGARFPQWKDKIERLLDCHRLILPETSGPRFPEVGGVLDDFQISAELGRGAAGRVFLAAQTSLENRPVVLKVTALSLSGHGEHLSLARLQHTHIVPLYFLQDFPDRNLRVLCMPYYGGATLEQLLRQLKEIPPDRRTGKNLLDALDQLQPKDVAVLPKQGPARQILNDLNYAQAICMIGAWLADALHYAHKRGLIHLDLKPANVLLSADGQPMLLDFHLAQAPLEAGGPPPKWIGGTPSYMSPEQERALNAVRQRQPNPAAVDGRSDLYSLGLVLYEALGGQFPCDFGAKSWLRRCNTQVSTGLADVLQKCNSPDPCDRYADAAGLAADLERHLCNQPLQGVANRSLAERWAKWRRRRPNALVQVEGAALVVFTGLLIGSIGFQHYQGGRIALEQSKRHLDNGQYMAAAETLESGLELIKYLRPALHFLPRSVNLGEQMEKDLQLAKHGDQARSLHQFVEQLRFCCGTDFLPLKDRAGTEALFRTAWDARTPFMQPLAIGRSLAEEDAIRDDLRDLGIIWADLRVRLGLGRTVHDARREGLNILGETEEMFGPSPVLLMQRQSLCAALGLTEEARKAGAGAAQLKPRTAWDYYSLGRFLLQSGDFQSAAREFDRAADLDPHAFWPNFYQGVCAYRLRRYDDALTSFRVCFSLRQEAAWCYVNRALAFEALGRFDDALHEYGRALKADPQLGTANLNRGTLYYRSKRYSEAVQDLREALRNGADPATVYYNLALIDVAQNQLAAARANLELALRDDPQYAPAQELRKSLLPKP